MTFKVTILGNSAAMPIDGRNPSAHVVNLYEQLYLIDCGEGTQNQLRKYGLSPLKIGAIFITHLHGDHFYGLFGLLSTMGLLGRGSGLKVYAPSPIKKIMETMDLLEPNRPFEVEYVEVDTTKSQIIFENKVMEVITIPLRHKIPTTGYLFHEKTPAKNIRKWAIERYELGIAQIAKVKKGEDLVLESGEQVLNSDITYVPHQARSYAYCSDTSRSGKVADIVSDVDLLYHEATFAKEDKKLARSTGHSTAEDAAKVAAAANVKRLIIGHFSGRYKSVQQLLDEAKELFPSSDIAEEGATYEIKPVRNE